MWKKYCIYLFFVIILYFYLFNPYPIRGGVIKLLYPLIFLIPYNKDAKFLVTKNHKVLSIFVLLFLYSFIIFIFGGQNICINTFINILECFFIPIIIVSIFNQYLNDVKLIDIVLVVSIIASCISIYLILNPDINFILREIVSRGVTDVTEVTRRSYGFSQFLLFSYPILLGCIIGYLILYGKLVHYLLIVILLIPIAFNARTGFFPIVISILFLFTPYKKNVNNKFVNRSLYFILLGLILSFVLKYLYDEYQDTIEWLNDGFSEFQNINKNNRSGTINTLLYEMFFLPDTILGILLGTGHDVYHATKNSDVGYVNQIWYGGIFYLLLLFSVYIKVFQVLFKKIPFRYSGMLFLSLLIANYKGAGFYSNELTRFLFLLFFYMQFKNRKDFSFC